MSGIFTSVVVSEHPYTRVKEPWNLDIDQTTKSVMPDGRVVGWRLFHYLSGGGIKAFGSTVEESVANRRRNRFLVFSAVLFVVWLVAFII